ncbi:hypothetical protein BH23CHL6_BH23CHL6_03840 [soil metagenome]
MQPLSGLAQRTLSALLIAISVALLTAGLFSYASSPIVGDQPPTALPTEIGNPVLGTDAAPTPGASASPAVASPSPALAAPSPALATPSPAATAPPAATPLPAATLPPRGEGAVASRIVIPALRVDLPILAGDIEVPGNRDSYPLCDVAQYLVYYGQPGEEGTSYIYGHAQRGMFLPLLRASQRNDGAEMLGALVEVYTADDRLHLYEIYRVKRHATDLSLANGVEPGEHLLVLQTSEGTRGHIPKLQVAARPIGILPADPEAANPVPQPRPCWR